MKYIIDFSNVKTLWDLHEAWRQGLMLPDFCGKNMDALWDCITGFIDMPAIVYITGINNIPKELTSEIDIMIKIFNRAVKWYVNEDGRFEYYII